MNTDQLFNDAQTAQAKNDFNQAVQLYQQFLIETKAATVVHNQRIIALEQSGHLYRFLGDNKASLTHFQQLQHEAKTDQERVIATSRLANQHSKIGQHDKALTLSTEAMALAQSNNDTFGHALSIQAKGGVLLQLGRYDEAVARLKTAVSLFLQIGDAIEEMRTWNLIGVTHGFKGELDKAITALEKAILLVRPVENIDTVLILCNLGEAYQGLYNNEKAIRYHQEALALAQKMPLPTLRIDPQRNLGVLLCRSGDIDQGLEYLFHALEQCEQLGVHDLTLQTLYSIASVECQRREFEKAAEVGYKLLMMAQQSDARGSEAQALYILGLCVQNGYVADELVTAEQYWHQALFLAHDTGQRTLLWQIHAALAQIGDNPQLNETHYRIAAEVIEQIAYPLEDNDLRLSFLNAPPIRAILDQIQQ